MENVQVYIEVPRATPQELVLDGHHIVLVDKGPKLHVIHEGAVFKVEVNRQKFSDEAQAVRAATLKLAELTQTRRFIQANAKSALEVLGQHKIYKHILALQGLKHLKGGIPPSLVQVEQLSLAEQFWYACEQYIINGVLPVGLNEAVTAAFNKIPKTRGGLHVLEALISESYAPNPNVKLYEFLDKAHAALKEQDKKATQAFDYKPQVGPTGEQEPIDPNSIETKVTPFFGGYYRGYVCAFDPTQKQIVQKSGKASPFTPDDLEEGKEYNYETVFQAGVVLELPYSAVPLPHTLNPNTLQLLRNDSGSFYLAPKTGATVGEKTAASFKFVLSQNASIALNDEPEAIGEVLGNFDEATGKFLAELEQNVLLSYTEKARRCRDYVRKHFKYPADEAARAQMNTLYLNAEATLLTSAFEHGIADCYWSNIFHGQMLAQLGIHHRLIAGHYISKDPRFDFAAIAGIGHAWGEVWNGEAWLRMDATPAKEKQDEEEQTESEPQEGDFGESASPEAQEELSLEEVRELFKEMLEQTQATEPSSTSAAQLFEQQTGVKLAKWNEVEAFIKNVNKTPIAAEASIAGRASTLQEEWEKLFDIIYKRREIPVAAYRGPVCQSEGDELDDPVDAVIDVLAGESDPSGYKIHAVKLRERVDVTEFEDDAILDLTGSMQGAPAEEQKKMLLSGLYNLMMLSRRLNLDTYRRKMKTPIHLGSHVLSFKGESLVSILHNPEQEIDEKALAFLYDELNKTQSGGGNLVGALQAYEAALDARTLAKLKNGECVKVLTIISDGGVNNAGAATQIIARLRAKGIVVQGLGFGDAAQDIRVICHSPSHPDAGVVLQDVSQAVGVRHKMLQQSLRNL